MTDLDKAKQTHAKIHQDLINQISSAKDGLCVDLVPNFNKVVNAMGLRANDCHRQLPRDNEYRGLGLGGGAICVEEAMLLAGLIWAHKPDYVIELGTSQGASSLVLAAACKDIGKGEVFTVDLAPSPPSTAWEIYDKFELPLSFVNGTNSLDYLATLGADTTKRYMFFSDTDIPVRPTEVQMIIDKFPRGTIIAVHDTSDLHPIGPMKLYAKLNVPMVQIDTPRGITILKV